MARESSGPGGTNAKGQKSKFPKLQNLSNIVKNVVESGPRGSVWAENLSGSIPNHLPQGALDPFPRIRRIGGGEGFASPSPLT